jgi:hypothetical protein
MTTGSHVWCAADRRNAGTYKFTVTIQIEVTHFLILASGPPDGIPLHWLPKSDLHRNGQFRFLGPLRNTSLSARMLAHIYQERNTKYDCTACTRSGVSGTHARTRIAYTRRTTFEKPSVRIQGWIKSANASQHFIWVSESNALHAY